MFKQCDDLLLLLLGSLQSGHCGHWPPSQTGLSLQKQKYFQLRLSNLTLAFGIVTHRRLLRYLIGCFADTITVKYLFTLHSHEDGNRKYFSTTCGGFDRAFTGDAGQNQFRARRWKVECASDLSARDWKSISQLLCWCLKIAILTWSWNKIYFREEHNYTN